LFQGCPFCARAIECATKLQKEVGEEKLKLEAVEHESRAAFKTFLSEKRKELAKKALGAKYHTASPIVYTLDSGHYIGGLDDMLLFLAKLPQFADTKTLKVTEF
jgi:glutaredoxin